LDILLPLVIHDPFPFVPQGFKEQLDEPRLELRFARPGVIGEVKTMVVDLSRGSLGLGRPLESRVGRLLRVLDFVDVLNVFPAHLV
jgi:hypothetical protein